MGKAKIMDLKELDFFNRVTHPFSCDNYNEFKGEEKQMLDAFLDRGILTMADDGCLSDEKVDRTAIADPNNRYIENHTEYKIMCVVTREHSSCPRTHTYLYEELNYRVRYGEITIPRKELSDALAILIKKGILEQYWSVDPITLQEEPTYRAIDQFKREEHR